MEASWHQHWIKNQMVLSKGIFFKTLFFHMKTMIFKILGVEVGAKINKESIKMKSKMESLLASIFIYFD